MSQELRRGFCWVATIDPRCPAAEIKRLLDSAMWASESWCSEYEKKGDQKRGVAAFLLRLI